MEASNLAAAPRRPVFEPSELVDHGDASGLTRSGQSGSQDATDGYDS